MTEINRELWLRAVQDIKERDMSEVPYDPTFLTMREFAQLIGLRSSQSKYRMAALIKADRVICSTRVTRQSNGNLLRIPVYKLKEGS